VPGIDSRGRRRARSRLARVALVAAAFVHGAAAGERPAPPPFGEPPLSGGTVATDLFGPDGTFRAALLGDGGSRPADLFARALVASIGTTCAEGPACDAAVLLGDNFYGLGVLGLAFPEGPMMRRRFHARYAALEFPFFAVLGNHEYLSPAPLASVRHTARHPDGVPAWIQPLRYWAARDGDDLELLFLDTMALIGETPLIALRDRQLAWLRDHCASTPAPRRRVAFGHHPAITFGKYRDTPGELLSPQAMEVLIACGVRHYASGHDHHLQRIDLTTPDGDVFHQVVSGKGGVVREPYPFADEPTRANPLARRWGGTSWLPTLATDHSGDLPTNAYVGWADLVVTRDGAVSARLVRTEEP
jgi:hypothetical protein